MTSYASGVAANARANTTGVQAAREARNLRLARSMEKE
jgi:hypothetical protein